VKTDELQTSPNTTHTGEKFMAFTPLVPVTLNIAPTKGGGQEFQSPVVKDLGGTAVDLSSWVSLTATAVAQTPGVNTADVTFGTVTADVNGIVTLVVAASDFSSSSPGLASLFIKGKPTSGDGFQTLARGTLTLQAG
jgi:hypothetical protein